MSENIFFAAFFFPAAAAVLSADRGQGRSRPGRDGGGALIFRHGAAQIQSRLAVVEKILRDVE